MPRFGRVDESGNATKRDLDRPWLRRLGDCTTVWSSGMMPNWSLAPMMTVAKFGSDHGDVAHRRHMGHHHGASGAHNDPQEGSFHFFAENVQKGLYAARSLP